MNLTYNSWQLQRFRSAISVLALLLLVGCDQLAPEPAKPSKPAVAWMPLTPPVGGYSCRMPGEPKAATNKFGVGEDQVEGVIYFSELPQGTFTIYAVPVFDSAPSQVEGLFDRFQDQLVKKSKASVLSQSSMMNAGVTGREFVALRPDGKHAFVRFFALDNWVVVMTVTQQARTPGLEAIEFLASLKLKSDAPPVAGAPKSIWRVFRSDEGGFSCEMPGNPERHIRKIESGDGLIEKVIYDIMSPWKEGYSVSYIPLPPKVKQKDSVELLDSFPETLASQFNGEIIESIEITQDNLAGRKHVVHYSSESTDMYAHCRSFIIQNNLVLVTAITATKEPMDNAKRFLDSIEWIKKN